MIEDLDTVLRKLLIRELPIKNGEVEVTFDQPKREWSARLSRPTLNLFLYDIRENLKLRGSQQWLMEQNPDGTVTQRRTPARVDLHYMITAWASEPDDEHSLLTRTLMALFRQPHLPQDLLPDSLLDQPTPIPMRVAQENEFQTPADVWSALDNEMRPAIALTLTVSIDPYLPIVTPLVRVRELRVGQSADPSVSQSLIEGTATDTYWTVGGTLHTDKPLDQITLELVDRGGDVPLDEDGRFSIGKLAAGEYTLEAMTVDGESKRFQITVPAPDYELAM